MEPAIRRERSKIMRTIRVTGKANLKVKPDITRITVTAEKTYPEYGEALEGSAKDTSLLGELLAKFGFERTDLKTLDFNVDTEYEGYNENGVYKQRFIGYRARHVMKVEFDSDNDRLGKILYALANCPVKPEFRISYTVKDPESAKNELLAAAVKDASEKAAVLAQAAGVKVKWIRMIDYSQKQIDFEVRPVNRIMADASAPMMAKSAGFDMDLEPEDIEVSDTVTVLWEIG